MTLQGFEFETTNKSKKKEKIDETHQITQK